jgi:pimeloyl-ACP methyl ester carboxylesterase
MEAIEIRRVSDLEQKKLPRKEFRSRTYQLGEELAISVDCDIYSADSIKMAEAQKKATEKGEQLKINPKEAVIYACGWPTRPGNPNFHDPFAQALADRSLLPTYYLDTSAEKAVSDPLRKEAEAMVRMIEDEGLEQITLIGHSEGGKKALYAAQFLQRRNRQRIDEGKEPIQIKGVIAIQAVGLHDQTSESVFDLMKNFAFKEGKGATNAINRMKNDPRYKNSEKIQQSARRAHTETKGSMNILASSIWKDLGKYGLIGYLGFLKNQARDMLKKTPGLETIDVPIILVQAPTDTVSNREQIIPSMVDQPIREAANAHTKKRQAEIVSAHLNGGSLPKRSFTERLSFNIHQAREKFLKATTFKESPYIRVVVPTKFSSHAIPTLRPEIASVIGLLDRYWRDLKPAA